MRANSTVRDPMFGILTLNGGASSLKFALFHAKPTLSRILDGKIDRIGQPEATLALRRAGGASETQRVDVNDQGAAVTLLLPRMASELKGLGLGAIGHRIVHGGNRFTEPCIVTPDVRAELQRVSQLDPEHLPFELELMDRVGHQWPDAVQIACFDTAFHRDLPDVAQRLPLPRRLFEAGVRRYGFHGLSYTFLLDELERTAGRRVAHGRLVLAHLGSGTSLTAIVGGRSVDTTMAFTPASGVPMGTRSGDLDPGVVGYLARTEGMTTEQFIHLVNRESGLLGISGVSSDIRDLMARASVEVPAAEAVDIFCYEITKRIGALAAAMGGIDGLVFTGGIGENAAPIRARICDRLGFLGLRLDPSKNEAGAPVISHEGSPAAIRVIRTDEERVIAEAVLRILETHASI
jgi:acetate kinase